MWFLVYHKAQYWALSYFLIYINELPSVVSSKVRLFADDCLIYRNNKNKEDQIALKKGLNLLENWG